MGWLDKLLGRGTSEAEKIADAEDRDIYSEADELEEEVADARTENLRDTPHVPPSMG
jgi:hypothetical protein